jgi:hypothetical protein
MAHTYNVSNWAAEVGGQPGLHSKIMSQKPKISWWYGKVVEYLPSMSEALYSIPNT